MGIVQTVAETAAVAQTAAVLVMSRIVEAVVLDLSIQCSVEAVVLDLSIQCSVEAVLPSRIVAEVVLLFSQCQTIP